MELSQNCFQLQLKWGITYIIKVHTTLILLLFGTLKELKILVIVIKSKRGTKLTVLTNNIGMPLDIICSAANVHDINFVLPSCKNMKEKGIEMESLIVEKLKHF